ncbi:MAG TPA: antibiotic biosynthesis monooxygenase [Streptosporangiaceae bacterium]|nr:antibiotic biosynthesis monooxygenase [Streptosporangiaceae bacterium]
MTPDMRAADKTLDERWGTFDIFRTESAAAAEAVAEAAARKLRSVSGDLPGLLAARVHVDLGGTVVVCRGQWDSPESADDPPVLPLREIAEMPGVRTTTPLGGIPAEGLQGPDAGRPPGIAVVAIRHLADQASADAALKLLSATGEWKRSFPGFVSAVPYVSTDGTLFVNYPTWVDEAAYRAWMADPRIAPAKAEVAQLDASSPEFLTCRVTADIGGL